MLVSSIRGGIALQAGLGMTLACLAGCTATAGRSRALRENQRLRTEQARLERAVAEKDAALADLRVQVRNLQGFPPDRPADLFAPVSIEIASLTGAADYDDRPGDDGVTVYLRPRDGDGHVVKAPGRIAIQLLDNTTPESPRVIGVYSFDDAETLRKSWYGRFGTQHYTLECRFPPDTNPPRQVHVNVAFTDFLTGRTLLASKVVQVTPPGS